MARDLSEAEEMGAKAREHGRRRASRDPGPATAVSLRHLALSRGRRGGRLGVSVRRGGRVPRCPLRPPRRRHVLILCAAQPLPAPATPPPAGFCLL